MKADDLIRMLEVDDAPAAGPDVVTGGPAAAPAAPAADTVLRLDNWSRRRGAELLAESDDIRKLAKLSEAAFAKGAAAVAAKAAPSADEEYWGRAVADFHAAAYEMAPEAHDRCDDPLRADFLKTVMETPEFEQIRAASVLNPVAAEVATVAFAAQFAKRREQDAHAKCRGPKPGAKGGKSDPGMDAEIATMRAAAAACAAAKKAVDEVRDAAEMCGLGDGTDGRKLDVKRLAAVRRKVAGSVRLKKIAEMAGRFRRLANSRQRRKVTHGQDEVVGITLGDEVARMIPAELARLADPDLELDTLRRISERQVMVRQFRATEPAGKGPIVVTVDESGSMNGAKIETAKGLALALAWIARKQRRWCVLIGFAGGTAGTRCVLPPSQWDEVALLDWLEHFFNGGTTMDVPLNEVPRWWPEFVAAGMTRGKTDMVMITDAEVQVPPALEKSFREFKAAEKVRLNVLVVQGDPGNIACVADEVNTVPALTVEADAVGAVLSI